MAMSAKRAGIVALAAAAGACALGLKALNVKQRQEEERATKQAIGTLQDVITNLTAQVAEGQKALQAEIGQGQQAVQAAVAEGQARMLDLTGQLQAAKAALQHMQQQLSSEQAEVRLAQEQARDAANARQQTETARLQLEGLHDQAVRASAELLQHIAALTGEKQSMQDSSASLQDLLSAKEIQLQQTQRRVESLTGSLADAEAAERQLRTVSDAEILNLQNNLNAEQVEIQLARRQTRDAADQQQRTEAARLQLEREQDQAVQARALLLQQNSALRVEKQGLQEVLRAKEEGVERLTGRLGVAETALGQLSQTSDAALLALRDQLSAEEAGHAAALAALEQQAMQHQAEVQQMTGRLEAAQHSQAAEVQQSTLLRSQVQGLSEELEGKSADVRALNASNHLLGQTIADLEIDRSDLSARLSQEERRSFTAGEEQVAASQSTADLQGAVAQLLEAVGSSQGHLQQELLKSKRCHVKEATSLHEKASSIRDELKEQLKAALSDKLQADQALEKLQREHEEQLYGLEQEATKTSEELAAVKKKLQSVGGRVNAMVDKLQSEADSLKQEKEAAVSQLRNELAQKEQEAQQVQERLDTLVKEREELLSSNSGLQKVLHTQGKQLKDEQEVHAAGLRDLRKVVNGSQRQVADLQKSLRAERASLQQANKLQASAELASVQKLNELQEMQGSADQARIKMEAALAEQDRLQDQLAAAVQQAGRMQGEVNKFRHEKSCADRAKTKAYQNLSSAQTELAQLKNKVQQEQQVDLKEMQRLQGHVDRLRADREAQDARTGLLQETIARLNQQLEHTAHGHLSQVRQAGSTEHQLRTDLADSQARLEQSRQQVTQLQQRPHQAQADAQPRPRALGSQPAYAQQQQQQRKWLPENVPVVGCPVRAVMADEALERLGGLDRWRCRICRDHGYAGYITMRGDGNCGYRAFAVGLVLALRRLPNRVPACQDFLSQLRAMYVAASQALEEQHIQQAGGLRAADAAMGLAVYEHLLGPAGEAFSYGQFALFCQQDPQACDAMMLLVRLIAAWWLPQMRLDPTLLMLQYQDCRRRPTSTADMCHKFVLPPVERHGQGENDLLFKEKSCNELTFHAMSEALGVAILTTTEQGTSQRDTKHFSAHDKWRAATVCIIAEDEHSTLALPHQGLSSSQHQAETCSRPASQHRIL